MNIQLCWCVTVTNRMSVAMRTYIMLKFVTEIETCCFVVEMFNAVYDQRRSMNTYLLCLTVVSNM